jgi:hypothetical protein
VSSKADEGYWREKAATLCAGRLRKGRGSVHVGVYCRTPKFLGDCRSALALSRVREMSELAEFRVYSETIRPQSLAGLVLPAHQT